ncbi:MAG: hypothetical protein QOJ67_2160 [Acidimicrobiaceae bacterium]
MPSVRHPVQWVKVHPTAADVLLAALLAAICVVAEISNPTGRIGHDPSVVSAGLTLVSAGALAWRRRAPLVTLTISGSAAVLYEVLGYHGGGSGLPVMVALYSAAAHGNRRTARISAAITAVALAIVIWANASSNTGLVDWVANYVTFGTAWILGDNLRTRRAYVASLESRAEMTQRERAAEAQQAVSDERARIARELHDVVAHGVSVMVVQASAARRVLDAHPDQAADALVSIEETGRQALDEMRRLLGVLRDDDQPGTGTRAPQPTLRDVRELVAGCREAGLRVELVVEGDELPMPAGIDLSAYRVVQEALTNALKHAGPASAHVVLRFEANELQIEVTDDGRGAASVPNGDGHSGHGLVGMRERVELFGGELRAGPQPGGGYRVMARFPLRPARLPV